MSSKLQVVHVKETGCPTYKKGATVALEVERSAKAGVRVTVDEPVSTTVGGVADPPYTNVDESINVVVDGIVST